MAASKKNPRQQKPNTTPVAMVFATPNRVGAIPNALVMAASWVVSVSASVPAGSVLQHDSTRVHGGLLAVCSVVLLFAAVAMCSRKDGSDRENELEAKVEQLRNRVMAVESEIAQLKRDGESWRHQEYIPSRCPSHDSNAHQRTETTAASNAPASVNSHARHPPSPRRRTNQVAPTPTAPLQAPEDCHVGPSPEVLSIAQVDGSLATDDDTDVGEEIKGLEFLAGPCGDDGGTATLDVLDSCIRMVDDGMEGGPKVGNAMGSGQIVGGGVENGPGFRATGLRTVAKATVKVVDAYDNWGGGVTFTDLPIGPHLGADDDVVTEKTSRDSRLGSQTYGKQVGALYTAMETGARMAAVPRKTPSTFEPRSVDEHMVQRMESEKVFTHGIFGTSSTGNEANTLAERGATVDDAEENDMEMGIRRIVSNGVHANFECTSGDSFAGPIKIPLNTDTDTTPDLGDTPFPGEPLPNVVGAREWYDTTSTKGGAVCEQQGLPTGANKGIATLTKELMVQHVVSKEDDMAAKLQKWQASVAAWKVSGDDGH